MTKVFDLPALTWLFWEDSHLECKSLLFWQTFVIRPQTPPGHMDIEYQAQWETIHHHVFVCMLL